MSTAQINYLNIGLMLASLVAAMALPFEVFLFSYAVLGPLHYLTEISWLHDRQYFTQRKWDWTVLAMLTVVVTLSTSALTGYESPKWLLSIRSDLVFLSFALALVFAMVKSWWKRGAWGLAALLLAYALHGSTSQQILFVLYFPTLVHVFLFTGAFILLGSLRHKDFSGYLSLAVFVACAVWSLAASVEPTHHVVSEYVQDAYKPLMVLNLHFVQMLGFDPITKGEVFTSTASLRAMRFIAWAYTYHYLNWFSKTKIIGWHEVSRRRITLVLVAWIGSVLLYAFDYEVGLKWLLTLSLAHVLLEFPLNHLSFVSIGREFAGRLQRLRGSDDDFRGGRPAVAGAGKKSRAGRRRK